MGQSKPFTEEPRLQRVEAAIRDMGLPEELTGLMVEIARRKWEREHGEGPALAAHDLAFRGLGAVAEA